MTRLLSFTVALALASPAFAAGTTTKTSPGTGNTTSDTATGTNTYGGSTSSDTLGTDTMTDSTNDTTGALGTNTGTLGDDTTTGTVGAGPSTTTGTTSDTTSTGISTADTMNNAADDSLVITFKKGQSNLTSDHKSQIRSYINSMKGKDSLNEAKIAVWSDKELLSSTNFRTKDRKLADARGKAIENFLEKELGVSNAEYYNMADKSTWLARNFNRQESELQSQFAKRDAEVNSEEFQVFKTNGAASSAIIHFSHPEMDTTGTTGSGTTDTTTTTPSTTTTNE
jgi:hypothetical protein